MSLIGNIPQFSYRHLHQVQDWVTHRWPSRKLLNFKTNGPSFAVNETVQPSGPEYGNNNPALGVLLMRGVRPRLNTFQ